MLRGNNSKNNRLTTSNRVIRLPNLSTQDLINHDKEVQNKQRERVSKNDTDFLVDKSKKKSSDQNSLSKSPKKLSTSS